MSEAVEERPVGLGPGDRLGHFEIGHPIGHGGMGLVFEARDLRLGRTVALKVLPPDLFENETARSRFLQEAQLAASITHPNIATIHEIDEVRGSLFIAMELVPGSNLRDVLKKDGPLAPERVVSLGLQACDALEAAHRQGVIHRDVKSSNFMVTPSGQAKMLDFGLAKALTDSSPDEHSTEERIVDDHAPEDTTRNRAPSTATGVAVGTPPYMSPEQAAGKPLDERSDIFSLGVVLYEAASGRLPFRGANEQEVLKAVRSEDPTPLHVLRDEVPLALSQVVARCLNKDPINRYESAVSLRSDLSKARERPRLSKRSLGLVAAVLSVAAAATLGLVFWPSNIPQAPLLAVLPLVNLSGSADEEYLADGMTEQLITRLSQIPTLRVISHRSVMPFKHAGTSLEEIASRLGRVDWFVSGTVRIAGPQVRLSIELTDRRNTNRIAREYQKPLENVLELQRELAQEIVTTLQLELSPEKQRELQQAYVVDDQAYRLYTQGRYFWNRRVNADYRTAIDHFEKALEIDPDFALAWAGLADAHLLLGPPSGPGRRDAYLQTVAAATRALELDPNLGEARAALGFAEFFLGWNWAEAEKQLTQALEQAPSYATAHHWYSDYLADMGRTEEAVAEIEIALELDPSSIAIRRDRAWPYFVVGRYQEAAKLLEEALEVDPTFLPARTLLARCWARVGRSDEAIAILEQAVKNFGPEQQLEMLGEVYAVAGKREKAEAILEELTSDRAARAWHYGVALIFAALDRREEAIDWLWEGYRGGDRTLVLLNVDPRLTPLETEDRFVELLRKMSFPNPRAGGG